MKRRDFLARCCGAGAGLLSARSVWWPLSAHALVGAAPPARRSLVMIVLEGGNDGLNTVVPGTDPLYYSLRPDVAIPANQLLGLGGGTGLHPQLAPLMGLWNEGRLAIVRDVGYPEPNLSHFRSSDIIFSASGSQEVLETGWLARWLESWNPTFPAILPDDPLALQQGLSAGLLLQGDRGVTGVVVDNPSSFYWLVNSNYNGPFADTPPMTRGGGELGYVRQIDRASFEYANAIQSAAEGGANQVTYPSTWLGDQLSVVAKLINGNMRTPVYVTAHGGFDTHASQPDNHPQLLQELAEALAAFIADLKAMGRYEDVAVMTVSEFGRRVEQNGTFGTDHGTASPWFVLGGGIQGGLIGHAPDLSSLDEDGNLAMQVDYRSIYSSILQGWFGESVSSARSLLGGSFPTIPFLASVGVSEGGVVGRPALALAGANPGRGPRVLRFTLAVSGPARLAVFDVAGRLVAPLAEGRFDAGAHEVVWPAERVSPGIYWAALEAGGERLTQKLIQQ